MSSFDSQIKNLVSSILQFIDPKGYVAAQKLEPAIRAEYTATTFVNVRGIINSCTTFNQNQKADADWIDFNLSDQTKENLSIYINTDSIARFIKDILPSINQTFVLVVGNSDKSFGPNSFNSSELQALFENHYLKVVFAQNSDSIHPKVIPMPIGIDYHNVWEKPAKNSLGYRITPLLHERVLNRILRDAPMIEERENLLYCNWHFKLERGDRQDCFKKIDHSLCYFEKQPVNRLENYRNQTKFKYVLSPAGLGIDCYRTWEAIILGCIPIVKRAPLFSQFTRLPVIIVDDWSEITAEFLDHSFESLLATEFDYGVLFLRYWQDVIKASRLPIDADQYKMTLGDFRNYFCRF